MHAAFARQMLEPAVARHAAQGFFSAHGAAQSFMRDTCDKEFQSMNEHVLHISSVDKVEECFGIH